MTAGEGSVASRLRGDGRGWILLTVAVGWLVLTGGQFLVPAVLPQVKESFGIGNTGGGLAITVLWATYGLTQTPAGLLSDRFGERHLLAGSLLLSAGSVVALGAAPVYLAFLAGCAAFGLAGGLYAPARGMLLSRTFPAADGTAIGLTLAAGSLGSAILPFLAGTLVGTTGWRPLVAGLLVPLVVVGALAGWTVPRRERTADPDVPPLGELAADVLRAVRIGRVTVMITALTLTVFVFQGLSAFLVTYLVDVERFDQRVAAGLFALVFVSGAACQVGGGVAADRIGERAVAVTAAGIGVLTVGAVPFVDGLVPFVALSVLLGTQFALWPVSNAYIIDALPESVRGTAWGSLRTAFFLVAATGPTVVGALADRGLFDETFLLLAGITAVATVVFAFVPSRTGTTH